jgi:hypothetical protein
MFNSSPVLVRCTLCIELPGAPLTGDIGFIMSSTSHVIVCCTLGIKSPGARFTGDIVMSSSSHVIVRCTLGIKSPGARLTGEIKVPMSNGCHTLVCCLTWYRFSIGGSTLEQ